ncbi:MAG: membrane protein insertion efficiency factor YidD [Bacillota bacterium]
MLEKCLLFLISMYQTYISPLKGPTCRYYPSCSQYARLAITIHGPIKGLFLSVWRVLRCNPFSYGGYDPVPPHRMEKSPKPRRFGECHT